MSDADLYISLGECFYGEGQISDRRFIPCGNSAAAGTQACCFQGDFCLSANVCYDNDTSVTYIAGCTDPTYSSSKCPHKAGYPDQQWVALARCEGDDIDLFSGCGHHRDEVAIKHEDCTCDAASALISNPASGQPTLNQIGLLPTTAGGTISFNPTALPTAVPSSSPSDPGSGGLSTGAKAGIGVGVGVGVPVIAATIFMFFFLRRKKKRQSEMQQQEQGQQPQPQQQQQYWPSQLPPNGTSHQPPMQQQQHGSPPPTYTPDTHAGGHGWLQHKPELSGESAAPKAELSADNNNTGLYEAAAGETSHDGGGGGNDNTNSIQNTPFEKYPPGGDHAFEETITRERNISSPSPLSVSHQTSNDMQTVYYHYGQQHDVRHQ